VERYQRHGAQIGDTATDGQLSYQSLREGWEVGSFTKDWARFWH
jgi:beta-lactamase superfamily II metal-dependent hydrolase